MMCADIPEVQVLLAGHGADYWILLLNFAVVTKLPQ